MIYIAAKKFNYLIWTNLIITQVYILSLTYIKLHDIQSWNWHTKSKLLHKKSNLLLKMSYDDLKSLNYDLKLSIIT